ncbi:hypothetical protein ACFL5U_04080 [Candidatus Margulisiibacteriota bacterium]
MRIAESLQALRRTTAALVQLRVETRKTRERESAPHDHAVRVALDAVRFGEARAMAEGALARLLDQLFLKDSFDGRNWPVLDGWAKFSGSIVWEHMQEKLGERVVSTVETCLTTEADPNDIIAAQANAAATTPFPRARPRDEEEWEFSPGAVLMVSADYRVSPADNREAQSRLVQTLNLTRLPDAKQISLGGPPARTAITRLLRTDDVVVGIAPNSSDSTAIQAISDGLAAPTS